MLAKYWKKIGMLILIIACVFNIMSKLVNKLSLNKEMTGYIQQNLCIIKKKKTKQNNLKDLKKINKYAMIKNSHVI